MKLGIISDIHGNYIALEACLGALEKERVDKIFCLGDTIGYLPLGNEVLDTITRNGILCIKGNHEAMLLGEILLEGRKDKIYGISSLQTTIHESHIERIRRFPISNELCINGKKILFIHGGPNDYLMEYVYEDYDMTHFGHLSYDTFFIGHTHFPFIYESPALKVINVGSCGLPRDYGGLACSAIYNTETESASIIRTPYRIKDILSSCRDKIPPPVLTVFNRKNKYKGRVTK